MNSCRTQTQAWTWTWTWTQTQTQTQTVLLSIFQYENIYEIILTISQHYKNSKQNLLYIKFV